MIIYNVYYVILYSITGYLYLLEGLYKKPRLKNEFLIKYYSQIFHSIGRNTFLIYLLKTLRNTGLLSQKIIFIF